MEKDEELTEEFFFRVSELRDLIGQSQAVRSFVDQGLLDPNYLVDERIRLLGELSRTARAMSQLLDQFLSSPFHHRELANQAKILVADSKAEIERFNLMAGNLDVEDHTDTTQ